MFNVPLRYRHWSYVWVPIITSVVWFGMLWAMLIVWLAKGRPKYPSQDGSIAYISDVGASSLKPLFIAGCSVTAVGFLLSLVIERYLRHSGRLNPHMRMRERVFSTLAVLGSLIGGCGLILLSIFDTERYTSAHRVFLLVFIVGVALSAIFTIIEYRWISKDFVDAKRLRVAYLAKAIIATILIALAIAFGIALFQAINAGGTFPLLINLEDKFMTFSFYILSAVLEWFISFSFSFYLLTFYFDLRESKGKERGEFHRDILMEGRQQ